MEEEAKKEQPLQIDVENVISSKNRRLAKAIPRFITRYLKRIIHQDEINAHLREYGHLHDAEFVAVTLKMLDTSYKAFGTENLPDSGRYIFVSNHPLGGLDGLVFINELSKRYSEVKFPVNDLLMNIKNLSGIFIPINKHGGQAKDAIKKLEETYASDSQVLYFPAGLCSRKRRGVISDLKWQKSFIVKAVQHKRDIIPAYFSGRNSSFFYNLANIRKLFGIKANIEMLYLPDEMFRQKGKDIRLAFGKPIPWQTFDHSKTPSEWADFVREKSYELAASVRD